MQNKLIGARPRDAALRAAAAILLITAAVLLFLYLPAGAQAAGKEITGLTLSSPNPGELVIEWDAASPAPEDHRVMWAKSSGKFRSYKKANTDEAGNAYPTGTSHTVTGLPEGIEYKVRVRARYGSAKPGLFSSLATVTISSTPEPTQAPTPDPTQAPATEPTQPPTQDPTSQPPDEGGSGSSQGRSTEPPAKPTGLLARASHDCVALTWDDSGDSTISGYQVFRGPDATSLTVLADDTGSAASSYTDSSVGAVTTYVYAVKARNANGLSSQSETISVTTLPDGCTLENLPPILNGVSSQSSQWLNSCQSVFTFDPATRYDTEPLITGNARFYSLVISSEKSLDIRMEYGVTSHHILLRDATGNIVGQTFWHMQGSENCHIACAPSITRTLTAGEYVIEAVQHYN